MNILLVRGNPTPYGVFGTFLDENNAIVCRTLERLFDGVPVIPVGTWTCRRRISPHFGYAVFELVDVPGHDYLEIHIANWERQLEGCIAVGKALGLSNQDHPTMLMNSAAAFKSFMALQEGVQSFTLVVK